MYRSLAEAAANCTRNIAAGFGPVFVGSEEEGMQVNEEEVRDRIAELSQALKDPDCSVRVNAVCALAEMGETAREAVPALIEALEGKDWVVRMGAITALGSIGDGAGCAVPALIEALEKEDLCASSAIALGRIGAEARVAIPALLDLHRKKNAFISWCAEEAVRSINDVN